MHAVLALISQICVSPAMNVLGTNPPKQTKRNEIGLQEFHTHASQPAVLMTPIKKRLKSESDWFSSYCSTRGTLTHGGASPRILSQDGRCGRPWRFCQSRSRAESRQERNTANGPLSAHPGGCRVEKMLGGPHKTRPICGQGCLGYCWQCWREKKPEIYYKILKLSQTKSIVLGKTRDCNIRLDSQTGVLSTHNTKDPFTIDNLTNEELKKTFEVKDDVYC